MVTNEQLRTMAQDALIEWDFNSDSDPRGAIKWGLEYIVAPGDFKQRFINEHIVSIYDWEGLETLAKFLATS